EGFSSKYLEVWKELYQAIGQKIKIHKIIIKAYQLKNQDFTSILTLLTTFTYVHTLQVQFQFDSFIKDPVILEIGGEYAVFDYIIWIWAIRKFYP
uniref:Uncharacterized protein n=1 Tax=Acrobeloides nanus TaxID=290746 RepID=A0A914E9F9_9BILA